MLIKDAKDVRYGTTKATAVYAGTEKQWPAWSPASLPGLLWWIDPSTMSLAEGAAVLDIPDLSGNGHTTSSLFGTNPTFAAGTPSAINFGSVSTPTNALKIASLGTTLSGLTTFTALVAVAPSSYANYPVIFSAPTDSNWNWIFEFDASNGVYLGVVSNHAPMYTPALPLSYWGVMTWVHNGPTDRLWLNGTEITTIASGSGGQSAIPYVGPDVILGGYYNNNYGLLGDLGECAIYNQALSDADRQQAETYLKAKWGVADVVPQHGIYQPPGPLPDW